MTSKGNLCPLCKGSGYYDVSAVGDNNDIKRPINSSTADASITMRNCNIVSGDVWLAKNDESYYESQCSGFDGNYENVLAQDLPGGLEKNDTFHTNTLKIAVRKLKENNWESNVSALVIIVRMSRLCPKMIDSSMPQVMRSLHSLLKNVRHHVIITACQIAEELFKTMQCTLKPEFDELVFALLQKTAYTNRLVRQGANKALDTMVVYIQPQHSIRVMCANSGAGHKNAIVRTTVSRLLYNVVCTIGVETFLTSSNLRDARRRTFVICMQFLNDSSIETRCNGRSLIELLMRHENFDAVFAQDVDRGLIKTFEQQLIPLKYKESKPAHAFEL